MFELRTEFAAANDFKTTLLCILIFHCILYVKLIVLNIVRPRPDISFLSNLRFSFVFASAPVYWVDEGVDTAVAHGQPEKEFFKYVFSRLRSVNQPVWKQEEQVDVLELIYRGHDQSHREVGLQIQGVFWSISTNTGCIFKVSLQRQGVFLCKMSRKRKESNKTWYGSQEMPKSKTTMTSILITLKTL